MARGRELALQEPIAPHIDRDAVEAPKKDVCAPAQSCAFPVGSPSAAGPQLPSCAKHATNT